MAAFRLAVRCQVSLKRAGPDVLRGPRSESSAVAKGRARRHQGCERAALGDTRDMKDHGLVLEACTDLVR